MKLELLPNQMLLNLFEYFHGIDLLYAFYSLNFRFNNLLYKLFRFYCLNFESISKHQFDIVCQQHLPFITDRAITLLLSNYKHTVGEINLFSSYITSFKRFTHLRSLTSSNLHTYMEYC